MKKMKKNIKLICLVVVLVFATSCDKEYLDPNSTLEPDVIGNVDNLIALVNGVQQRWSTDRAGVLYTSIHIAGLNTGELRLLNPGNLGENELLLGGDDVNGGNELLTNIWTNVMLVRKEATTVIDAAEKLSDQEIGSSLKAYGLFYRAMSHGTLIQYFESIPLEIIQDAPFKTKAEVLSHTLADLEMAKQLLSGGVASTVSAGVFDSVDLPNSVNALIARFNLMAGNYPEAVTAVANVNLGTKSSWKFDAALTNPLAFWFGSQNVTQAKNISFGLPLELLPASNDQRVPFYITAEDFTVPSPNYQIDGFWSTNLTEIPVFLPGEILLIKAEALARDNKLPLAIEALNDVLNKTASDDTYGLGASLADYSGAETKEAILDAIYQNRRIELYLTGMSLEDSRRFDRPNSERNRNYYPYPNAERDNNTNTPQNPSF